jgi:large-conductance mechanosensitive channel
MTIKENVVNTVKELDNKVTVITSYIVENIAIQSNNFFKFLLSKNVITICIGLLISTQFSKIVTVFADEILAPIINIIMNNNTKKLEDYKTIVFGVEFKIGTLVLNIISFILILLLIYFIYIISSSTDTEFLHKFINNIKHHK